MIEVNFFWIGNSVSPVEILAFKSCLSNSMTPILWSYENISDLPNGVCVKNANEIIPYSEIKSYLYDLELPIPSVSDIFRYRLLYKHGGIYSDTDIIFTRNIESLGNTEYFCSTFEYIHNTCASNCFMKLNKGSSVAKFLVEESNKKLLNFQSQGTSNFNYCDLGPFLVQDAVRKLGVLVLTYDFINPISWRFTDKIIAYKKRDYRFLLKNLLRKFSFGKIESRGYFLTESTYAVHLCHEMWRLKGINKYETLHPSCLYEKLKKRYSIN